MTRLIGCRANLPILSVYEGRHHFVLPDGSKRQILRPCHSHRRAIRAMDGERPGAIDKNRLHVSEMRHAKRRKLGDRKMPNIEMHDRTAVRLFREIIFFIIVMRVHGQYPFL